MNGPRMACAPGNSRGAVLSVVPQAHLVHAALESWAG